MLGLLEAKLGSLPPEITNNYPELIRISLNDINPEIVKITQIANSQNEKLQNLNLNGNNSAANAADNNNNVSGNNNNNNTKGKILFEGIFLLIFFYFPLFFLIFSFIFFLIFFSLFFLKQFFLYFY